MANVQQITQQLVDNISHKLIGKQDQILLTLTCMVAGGHVLLEDVPGLGKTTLAKSLAASISAEFKRVQCTPDLMPSDITGVTIFNQQKQNFEFIKGPVFTQILLADEINRTNPRTQSALLEAMAESTVSVDRDTYPLPPLFFVIATQNPIDFSGTYALPEAQMDRFMMCLSLGYPGKNHEISMMKSQNVISDKPIKAIISAENILKLRQLALKVPMPDAIYSYISDIVIATRNHEAVHLGASPRASLALVKGAQAYALLTGRTSITPDIIQTLAEPILKHRIIFKNSQQNATFYAGFFDELLSKTVKVPDNPG